MKAIRTTKLKISGSTKAPNILPIWLSAINWLSNIVYKTKELNSNRLAQAHYSNLREKGLPSQLACSACKVVCAAYKTAKLKGWNLVVFKKAVIPIVFKRDFNRTKKGLTLWGELLSIKDSRPLPENWKDSKLKLINKQWWLFLSHEIDTPEIKPTGSIVGVDLGVKRMIVATNSNNSKTFFFKGGDLNHRRACIRQTRADIQSVGTRNSRRLLKRMSNHEAAVTAILLHKASKALVSYAVDNNARLIVMEDLSNIRDSSLDKGKDFRSKIHRWPYADMQFKIAYKAEAKGIEIEKVSPKNTSRGCNVCGHVEAANRKGLIFCCKKCNHREDADRHASKNIRARSVSIKHNSIETGSYKPPQSYGTVDTTIKCSVGSG